MQNSTSIFVSVAVLAVSLCGLKSSAFLPVYHQGSLTSTSSTSHFSTAVPAPQPEIPPVIPEVIPTPDPVPDVPGPSRDLPKTPQTPSPVPMPDVPPPSKVPVPNPSPEVPVV